MRFDHYVFITGMAIYAAIVLASHSLWIFYEAWR